MYQLPRKGRRFGRLVVLRPASNRKGHKATLCLCDCGKAVVVINSCLREGYTKSCGCYKRDVSVTHGLSKTPEYWMWVSMRDRCNRLKSKSYHNYGGRGIKVCNRWDRSVKNFLADVGQRPSLKHTLDRINNDGDYEPKNVRWATWGEQSRNTRRNRRLVVNGVTKTMMDWSISAGLKFKTIQSRLRLGWSEKRAVTTQARKMRYSCQ